MFLAGFEKLLMETEAGARWGIGSPQRPSQCSPRRWRRELSSSRSRVRRGRVPAADPSRRAGERAAYGAAVGKVTEPLVFSGRTAAMKALNCSAFVTLPW